jgi:hypothetical protein
VVDGSGTGAAGSSAAGAGGGSGFAQATSMLASRNAVAGTTLIRLKLDFTVSPVVRVQFTVTVSV